MNLCFWACSHPAASPDGTALLCSSTWLLTASGQTWAQVGEQSLFLDIHTGTWTYTAPFLSTHVPTKTSQHETATFGWCSRVWESGSDKEWVMVCNGRSRKSLPSQQRSKHPGCNGAFTEHKSPRKHGTNPCPRCRGTEGAKWE